MSERQFTAQEMRDEARGLEGSDRPHWSGADERDRLSAMLRYAADVVERCDKLVAEYSKLPCEQCADGEVEPDCPYYGDPDGCNSPTYHKFHDWHVADIGCILRGDAGKEG